MKEQQSNKHANEVSSIDLEESMEDKVEDSAEDTTANPVKEFLGYTTAHGLGRVNESTGVRRYIWLIFLLATYVGFSIHLSTLIVRFTEHPLLTSYNHSLPYSYPDFYICPKNLPSISRIVRQLDAFQIANLKGNLTLTRDSFKKLFIDYAKSNSLAVQIVHLLDFNIWATDTKMSPQYAAFTQARRQLEKILLKQLDDSPPLTEGKCYNLQDKGKSSYRGTISITIYDKLCLRWDNPDVAAKGFPPEPHNYCRNPDGSEPIPWCYVRAASGIGLDYQHCPVPVCLNTGFNNTNCFRRSDKGEFSYKGTKNTTISGNKCKNWMQVSIERYRLYNHSYCRNPVGEEFEPFCFTEEPDGDWDYCGVQQCPENDFGDCYRKEDAGFRSYTGSTSSSLRGYTCQRWKSAYPHDFDDKYKIYDHNYCRNPIGDERKPWCYTTAKDVVYDLCNIPQCNQKDIEIIADIIHDAIGEELIHVFGNDLFINLVECSMGGITCDRNDFTTFFHPSVGTCYRFNATRFISGKEFSDIAHMKLDLKLFSDAADLRGHYQSTVDDITLSMAMESRLKTTMFASNGFALFVMPQGEFPHYVTGIKDSGAPIPGGTHTEVHLQYNRRDEFAGSGCIVHNDSQIVQYSIANWPSVLNPVSNKMVNSSSNDNINLANASDWKTLLDEMMRNLTVDKLGHISHTITNFKATESDCINEYIINNYIQHCKCVPSFLPIPVKLMKENKLCLNDDFPTTKSLIDRVSCYRNQTSKLPILSQLGEVSCNSRCVVPSYSIRTQSSPWPDLSIQEMVKALYDITFTFGYPKVFAQYRGITGMFFGYLFGQSLIYELQGGRQDYDFSENFTTFTRMSIGARTNLAKLTVSGKPYGQLTIIEEAYPLKNLFADIGGILGLYSGISVLTALEVVELIIFLVMLCRFANTKRKDKKAKKEADKLASQDNNGKINRSNDYLVDENGSKKIEKTTL